MENNIEVLFKKPFEEPQLCKIDNTPFVLSELLGGNIDSIKITDNITIICNKEGKLLELPSNVKILRENGCDTIIVGNIIIAGMNTQGYFTSLNEDQKNYLKKINLIQ